MNQQIKQWKERLADKIQEQGEQWYTDSAYKWIVGFMNLEMNKEIIWHSGGSTCISPVDVAEQTNRWTDRHLKTRKEKLPGLNGEVNSSS